MVLQAVQETCCSHLHLVRSSNCFSSCWKATGSQHAEITWKEGKEELHLVHWNAVKFENFEDAAPEENGLAVIGVFLKVSPVFRTWQKFFYVLPSKVRYKKVEAAARPLCPELSVWDHEWEGLRLGPPWATRQHGAPPTRSAAARRKALA
ncbi:carbonic anhydrase 5B, mitochondrial-like [Piliocolobus tephrosceles]|uniref:carbonic anhydrase 5B, mitochondrial-like n=1 Tax=Piliocolobus tephrosceles TaxID=591936 RepID=UPI000E6B2FA6|nr:carbonic anhydrase 5B, mitochondrial-like [Piliocolobus tephrosceles]